MVFSLEPIGTPDLEGFTPMRVVFHNRSGQIYLYDLLSGIWEYYKEDYGNIEVREDIYRSHVLYHLWYSRMSFETLMRLKESIHSYIIHSAIAYKKDHHINYNVFS